MDYESQQSFAPGPMRSAVEKVLREKESFYQTQNDLQLNILADTQAWEPSNDIKELVRNFRQIEVKSVGESVSFNEINKDLRAEANKIGLVLLGANLDRHNKPLLIALVTETRIYAIKPHDTRAMTFLKIKLNDDKLEFWTSNGLNESDCLYHNYGINLLECSAKIECCTGAHLHLMKKMSQSTEAVRLMYPKLACLECKRKKARIEKFEKLIEIWLDINQSEIHFNKNAMWHLKSQPLNLTAINIIKKRCILVRYLAQALDKARWIETRNMFRNSFTRLLDCHGVVRKIVTEEMLSCETKQEVDIGYFAHLDSGTSKSASDVF